MVPSAPRVLVWSHSKSDVASHKETEGIGAPGQFPRIIQLHGTWGMKVLRCRPALFPLAHEDTAPLPPQHSYHSTTPEPQCQAPSAPLVDQFLDNLSRCCHGPLRASILAKKSWYGK